MRILRVASRCHYSSLQQRQSNLTSKCRRKHDPLPWKMCKLLLLPLPKQQRQSRLLWHRKLYRKCSPHGIPRWQIRNPLACHCSVAPKMTILRRPQHPSRGQHPSRRKQCVQRWQSSFTHRASQRLSARRCCVSSSNPSPARHPKCFRTGGAASRVLQLRARTWCHPPIRHSPTQQPNCRARAEDTSRERRASVLRTQRLMLVPATR